ncbi:MAG: hypothetical protein ACRDHZ_11455, partial [Ktedonobacteraceae bacterium]
SRNIRLVKINSQRRIRFDYLVVLPDDENQSPAIPIGAPTFAYADIVTKHKILRVANEQFKRSELAATGATKICGNTPMCHTY